MTTTMQIARDYVMGSDPERTAVEMTERRKVFDDWLRDHDAFVAAAAYDEGYENGYRNGEFDYAR